MKAIGSLLGLYLGVGIVIALLQMVLVETIEPACDGMVEHRLWRHHQSCRQIERQVGLCHQDTSRAPIVIAKVIGAWLPDVIRVFTDGQMTLKEYALAGYHCRQPPALDSFQLPAMPLPTIVDERPLGSLAARALQERLDHAPPETYLTLEPFAGVRLELPGSWRVLDEQAIRSETPPGSLPDTFQVRLYFPPSEPPQAQVSLMRTPSPLSAAEPVRGLTDTHVRELATRFIQGLRHRMSNQGYRLPQTIEPEWTRTADRLTLRTSFEAVAAPDQRLMVKQTWIVTQSQSVAFGITFQQPVSADLQQVLRHAEASFAVSEN